MLENKRQMDLLEIVQGTAFTPVQQMADLLDVTTRTVRSDVASLNEQLEDHGAIVSLRRGQGYHLERQDPEAFQIFISRQYGPDDHPDLSTSDARFRTLLKLLLESDGYVTSKELSEILYLGESALQVYVRQAKDVLGRYGIECISKRSEGFRVFGRESDRRDCFANEVVDRSHKSYATGFTADEQAIFDKVDLYQLSIVIKEELAKSPVSTTDYGLKNLMVHFALMISRIKAGCLIESGGELEIPTSAARFIGSVCLRIEETYDIQVPEAERRYIYRHLLVNGRFSDDEKAETWLQDSVERLLDVVHVDYGYDLHKDETLRRGLLGHLESMFRAKELNNQKKNPLLNTIKTSFPLIYEITLMSTEKVFINEPYTLDENDVGYLSLHIGAAIGRVTEEQGAKLGILVVCADGDAATSILASRIESFFGDRLEIRRRLSHQEYQQLTEEDYGNVSFVVSTVPLNDCPRPTALVGFDLNPQNVKTISKLMESLASGRFSDIRRFFSPASFFLVKDGVDKDTLLKTMGDELEDEGIADQTFFASTLEREAVSDTSLSELFAIPHTMKPQATHTRVSVAILEQPLPWSPETKGVQIVFLLAAKLGDRTEMEHLYDLLVRIVEDKGLQQDIARCDSFEGLMRVLVDAV
jgi:lichenan operon transcriptional antiterminator